MPDLAAAPARHCRRCIGSGPSFSAPSKLLELPPAPEANPAYRFLLPETAPPTSGAQLLQRLGERFADPPCVTDPLVQRWQSIYARSPQRFSSQIAQTLPLLGLALDEVERYRLPGEFALLPIVESWYRPEARGAGDHVGLWQLGRSTATHLELPVSNAFDGRMDAFASTDAALRYLAWMQNQFGDWKLAVLGFNAGPYRLRQQLANQADVRFSAQARLPAGLPGSSYEHVAKMKALACLLTQPERFGIELPEETRIDPLVQVSLPPGRSTLDAIAADREVPSNLLIQLNPAFRNGVVAANAPRRLLVPESLAGRFDAFQLPLAATPAAGSR